MARRGRTWAMLAAAGALIWGCNSVLGIDAPILGPGAAGTGGDSGKGGAATGGASTGGSSSSTGGSSSSTGGATGTGGAAGTGGAMAADGGASSSTSSSSSSSGCAGPCDTPPECHTGTGVCTAGVCDYPTAKDGSKCSLGTTMTGVCSAGTCVAGCADDTACTGVTMCCCHTKAEDAGAPAGTCGVKTVCTAAGPYCY